MNDLSLFEISQSPDKLTYYTSHLWLCKCSSSVLYFFQRPILAELHDDVYFVLILKMTVVSHYVPMNQGFHYFDLGLNLLVMSTIVARPRAFLHGELMFLTGNINNIA